MLSATDAIARRSILDKEQDKLTETDEQIALCRIVAPQDGMVVYYVNDQNRFGSGSAQSIVAQGEPVREGQKLMRIPNLNKMVVATRIHEAMISRVRGERLKRNSFGDQATLGPNVKHWFTAGPQGAVVSEFSTRSRDEADIFTDAAIRRVP